MKKFVVLFYILIPSIMFSQTFVPGNSYYGTNNYIEYIAGNLPLIITVPHGGDMGPSSIPDRTCGSETVTDSYTVELAQEIKAAIFQLTGKYPHIVINHLKRIKLDANRDLTEAACGNSYAITAWNEFHTFIGNAKTAVNTTYGKGLYIDLHGHGHSVQQLELGYLLTTAELSVSDVTLNQATTKNKSSIKNLANSNVLSLAHADLIRGDFSLGAMMETLGYPSVPSKINRFPVSTYFTGGYNSDRYGSKTSGTIDAIQIECNQDVRFTTAARQTFATKAAQVLLDYLTKHYFPNLTDIVIIPAKSFVVYPNPAINSIHISGQKPSLLKVYDLLGRVTYSKPIQGEEVVDISRFNVGIYMFVFYTNGKILYSEKVIKTSE
jgi:N-formylglutamate amidohydrolase